MKKEIKLQSRGGVDNKLIHIEDNKYQLQTPYNYRIGFEQDPEKDIIFIDPAGGPFMQVGTEIDGRIIKMIYPKGIIEFENEIY